mmetsp:Transcript_10028/g.18239  ORF Transcript_10028/g.18239 Transcript_10028/m.18239 type:complete len:318 (+) Transcript_10028:111-1064(+)
MAAAHNGFDFNNKGFVQEVARLIHNNIPQVKTLVLDNNNISALAALEPLTTAAKSLQNLSLANNRIAKFEDLQWLHKLKNSLVHLILDPNPGTSPMLAEVKMAAVRELFPNLQKLGNMQCREIINFNLPENITRGLLPDEKGSYFDAKKTQELTTTVIQKYLQIFERENRERLDTFYFRETSCFSIAFEPLNFRDNDTRGYSSQNRNLIANTSGGGAGMSSLTRVGRSIITATLKNLPEMIHDIGNFTADAIVLPSETGLQVIHVSLRGVYLESPTLRRHFNRVMILAPTTNEHGVGITNDMLFVGELVRGPPPGNA